MPPANRRARESRTYDPAMVRKALIGQLEAVAEGARQLTPEQRALPSGLPGWDVHALLVHIALQIDAVPRMLGAPAPRVAKPEVSLASWAWATAGAAAELDDQARSEAAGSPDGVARIEAAIADLEPVLEAAVREDVLVPHPGGAMRVLDFTVTRLVELVVHSDDLTRATGTPVRLNRQALASTVRLLVDALAAKAPGRSVELRVPPFAVTQCVEGPRHTRGTPPNVVEADAITWIRLATGRTDWAAALATGRLTASGERADLGGHLPVLG
ncbi:maleylpyruvate isomerase family mycothiol-dependent enzyme [Streptomyces sp. AJS327]|uniref:maleylpyruvate isomerase family mycothiol-dependent enzyme n=1 Tax=Streptomyces sp. AJS327 TaxID=2545265 RepID=UPI0015DFC771|nr:maleylpyruvate isomerase family mycothiol-dependent enzyme [Streptomyces sp. AJS327]MBA0053587.1 maleylpyruvate isomerase family mycothiol-dependent enzyme [Streptomyces sp. AJS327]